MTRLAAAALAAIAVGAPFAARAARRLLVLSAVTAFVVGVATGVFLRGCA